jgi:gliding motility-associated-like protein
MVTNDWGCADTVIKTIIVDSDYKLFVPNAFTPNGDGLNDTFQPKGRGLAKYTLSIYDRWGTKVFQTSDFETGWDGGVYGKNSSDDTFVWKINGVDVKGRVKELSGYVTLAK